MDGSHRPTWTLGLKHVWAQYRLPCECILLSCSNKPWILVRPSSSYFILISVIFWIIRRRSLATRESEFPLYWRKTSSWSSAKDPKSVWRPKSLRGTGTFHLLFNVSSHLCFIYLFSLLIVTALRPACPFGLQQILISQWRQDMTWMYNSSTLSKHKKQIK